MSLSKFGLLWVLVEFRLLTEQTVNWTIIQVIDQIAAQIVDCYKLDCSPL